MGFSILYKNSLLLLLLLLLDHYPLLSANQNELPHWLLSHSSFFYLETPIIPSSSAGKYGTSALT